MFPPARCALSRLALRPRPLSSHLARSVLHRPLVQRWQSTTTHETPATTKPAIEPDAHPEFYYYGPLTSTFRKLKLFSLSSLALSTTLSPLIFVVESNLPTFARAALCATALGTSGISTLMVSWCGAPYVALLARPSPNVLQMTTLTLFLASRTTTVYDRSFLVETKRAFAKWELAETVNAPSQGAAKQGTEETVAETTDATGKVLGRWIVTWGENGQGTCRSVGSVVRHFNVHEELL